jgi:hypothetical protein
MIGKWPIRFLAIRFLACAEGVTTILSLAADSYSLPQI